MLLRSNLHDFVHCNVYHRSNLHHPYSPNQYNSYQLVEKRPRIRLVYNEKNVRHYSDQLAKTCQRLCYCDVIQSTRANHLVRTEVQNIHSRISQTLNWRIGLTRLTDVLWFAYKSQVYFEFRFDWMTSHPAQVDFFRVMASVKWREATGKSTNFRRNFVAIRLMLG